MSDRLLILLILVVVPVGYLLARDAIAPMESVETPTVFGPVLIEHEGGRGGQVVKADQPGFVTVGVAAADESSTEEPTQEEPIAETPFAGPLAAATDSQATDASRPQEEFAPATEVESAATALPAVVSHSPVTAEGSAALATPAPEATDEMESPALPARSASSRESFRHLVDFAQSKFDWNSPAAPQDPLSPPQSEAQAEAPAAPPAPDATDEPLVRDTPRIAQATPPLQEQAIPFDPIPGKPRELAELPLGQPAAGAPAESMEISIGSGAIKLQAPNDWYVYEAPVARELRLVLSPTPIESLREMPDDALWLSYQVRQREPSLDDAKLRSLALSRMKAATKGRGNEGELMPLSVDGAAGVLLPFQSADANGQHGGFHSLLRTSWGICEVHGTAPYEVYEVRRPKFEAVLSSLRFGGLKAPPEPAAKVRDAGPILGTWKAFRSRFRLFADGRIELLTDSKEVKAIDEVDEQDVEQLAGGFEASGDLMYVVWADGSRLNFRWRLVGDRLLLTDHEGRISELRRMLE